jgi:putative FmdB family regulatory protein
MPLYEYQCDVCVHRFEVIQKFSDPHIDICPKCGGAVHKLFSSPAIQFKGSGFYITDYARGGKSDAGETRKQGDSGTESRKHGEGATETRKQGEGATEARSHGDTGSKTESKSESGSESKSTGSTDTKSDSKSDSSTSRSSPGKEGGT